MKNFVISNLQDSSILSLNDMRDTIKIDPEYQREGGIWSLDKRQLFIDSLINKYDVPKFYFHHLAEEHSLEGKNYSIIDGRQRLEAIWDFLDGKFALADNVEYIEDPAVDIRNLTYAELAKHHPRIATRLNGRTLTVIVVSTSDLDFIEDMFTRLNEAAPLNAAEKRNSFGGPLPRATRDLVKMPFFEDRIRIAPTRYRHHDLVAKMLYLEFCLQMNGEVGDTKKSTLDAFYKSLADDPDSEVQPIVAQVQDTVTAMAKVFVSKDTLLKSSGTIPVYYVFFSMLGTRGQLNNVDRRKLLSFEQAREANRQLFAMEQEGVNRGFLEYDELSRSSNDAAAIDKRVTMLEDFVLAPDDAPELDLTRID